MREITSRRAGALAEMCGAAKHKRVKLSVNAAAEPRRLSSRPAILNAHGESAPGPFMVGLR
jgi:hypothetical protein